MRCTCCLLILTLWSAAAGCNNRMPMCIGSFSLHSKWIGLSKRDPNSSVLRRDVESDRLIGNSLSKFGSSQRFCIALIQSRATQKGCRIFKIISRIKNVGRHGVEQKFSSCLSFPCIQLFRRKSKKCYLVLFHVVTSLSNRLLPLHLKLPWRITTQPPTSPPSWLPRCSSIIVRHRTKKCSSTFLPACQHMYLHTSAHPVRADRKRHQRIHVTLCRQSKNSRQTSTTCPSFLVM